MNDQLVKIKHIAPVYLIAFTLTTLVLLAVRWLLSIRFEVLNINEDIWEVWLPMFAPWLTVYLSIKSRIQILKFDKENNNRHFGFQMLALLSLVPVLFISQSLLTSATSKLTELDNVYQIEDTRKSRYYTVNDFHVANYYGGSFAFVRTGGRYNEDLDVTLYFAFPITLTEGEQLKPQPKYWYGVRYHKRINNRLSQSEKEEIYDRFYQKSLNKIDDYDFHDLTMLERLPTSEDRDHFLKAVKARTKLEPDSDTVILRPSKDNFEDLNGDKLEWIFYSFGIGVTVFLLLLLVPGLDEEEYRRQLKGHKPEGDSFIEFASLLIPNKEYFVSPILISVNIIIFVIGLLAGLHILHPSAMELLQWGGNRRFEIIHGEWWRLITSMFLHGGIIHLLFNCYGLIIASIFIEPVIGRWRFIVVYMLAGICGSLASIWWHENTVSVGASGAIFGLYGAIFGLLLTNAFPKGGKSGVFSTIGIYVGINLLWGITGGVDNAAHIGGLLSGFVFSLIIYLQTKKGAKLNF